MTENAAVVPNLATVAMATTGHGPKSSSGRSNPTMQGANVKKWVRRRMGLRPYLSQDRVRVNEQYNVRHEKTTTCPQ